MSILKLKHGSTLRTVKKTDSSDLTWLLIPGGPGIESGYLASLFLGLPIEGNIVCFDLPRIENYPAQPDWAEIVREWKADLMEAAEKILKPIIVGHSFGGMLALSVKDVQSKCIGAVFLASSPSKGWEKHSAQAMKRLDSTEATKAEERFAKKPSDLEFKHLCIAWAPFYFLPKGLTQGTELLSRNSYNHLPYHVCGEFFRDYRCTWSDWRFPTLCLAGDSDLITPLSLFQEDTAFSGQSNIEFAEIKEAGHFPWVENPSQFTGAILQFKDKILVE